MEEEEKPKSLHLYRNLYLLKILDRNNPKFPLNNRHSSKTLRFNRLPSKIRKKLTVNRQSYYLIEMRASSWSLLFRDVFETNGREIPVRRTSLGSRDPKRLGRPEKA